MTRYSPEVEPAETRGARVNAVQIPHEISTVYGFTGAGIISPADVQRLREVERRAADVVRDYRHDTTAMWTSLAKLASLFAE